MQRAFENNVIHIIITKIIVLYFIQIPLMFIPGVQLANIDWDSALAPNRRKAIIGTNVAS